MELSQIGVDYGDMTIKRSVGSWTGSWTRKEDIGGKVIKYWQGL